VTSDVPPSPLRSATRSAFAFVRLAEIAEHTLLDDHVCFFVTRRRRVASGAMPGEHGAFTFGLYTGIGKDARPQATGPQRRADLEVVLRHDRFRERLRDEPDERLLLLFDEERPLDELERLLEELVFRLLERVDPRFEPRFV
jgi:hypothetical protein